MVVQMDKKQVIVNKKDMIEAKKTIATLQESLLSTDSLLKIAILAGSYGDVIRKEMNVDNSDWVNFFDVLKERNSLLLSTVDNFEASLPSYLEIEENKDSEIAA